MAKLISQSCGDSKLAVCLPKGRWGHLKATQALVDAIQAWEKRPEWKQTVSTFSSSKHISCWCIDVANRWRWKSMSWSCACIRPFWQIWSHIPCKCSVYYIFGPISFLICITPLYIDYMLLLASFIEGNVDSLHTEMVYMIWIDLTLLTKW